MTQPITVTSIQVGLPRDWGTPDAADALDRPWRSAIFKQPVSGPVWLSRTGLDGDSQVAPTHGGPEMAVLAYAQAHYPRWQAELQRHDTAVGGFGENFTVRGQDETDVCLGDVYAVGDAIVQVSQPRTPCWKLARRWRQADLVERVLATGRHGWFFRVLEEGHVSPGQCLALRDRPLPAWSMARVGAIKHGREVDSAGAAELAYCEMLAPDCRAAMAKLARAAR